MTTILTPYHLDEQLPELTPPDAPSQVITADLPDGSTWARLAELYDRVADAVAASVAAGERPTVVSGDCTTALGTVAGLQRAGIDPAVVWFDAHGDLNTLESSPSGYLGGMPLRMLVGYGRELVADALGLRDLREDRVVLVDARDLDPGEVEYLATAAVTRVPVEELTEAVLPDGPIYLHMDFDVIAGLPGLLFPAPGGPAAAEVAAGVRRVTGTGRVVATGAACTWAPGHGTADLAFPVISQ